ncbi:MAG TPA: tetratricopeptide repeat protein [bacterium]|jgi:tetratricopeptide (TPR) repeat protein
MTQRISILLFALLALSSLALADARSGFEEGLRLYRSNDIDGAITAWENVVRQGEVSGPLYYNLGNAYFRAKKYGLAILNYERAHKLLPRDHDVVGNLDLTRMATVDKIEPSVRLVVWNWVDSVRDHFSLHELAMLFYAFGFACAAFLVAGRLGAPKLRQSLKTVTVVLLVFYVLSGAWYVWRASLDARPYGVVMATKTDAYSAPDDASKQLFSLHEGTRVQIGESLSGWVNVRLVDGRKGWIPLQSLEKI